MQPLNLPSIHILPVQGKTTFLEIGFCSMHWETRNTRKTTQQKPMNIFPGVRSIQKQPTKGFRIAPAEWKLEGKRRK